MPGVFTRPSRLIPATVTEDVILAGGGLTLTLDVPYRPTHNVWTRFHLKLHEAAG